MASKHGSDVVNLLAVNFANTFVERTSSPASSSTASLASQTSTASSSARSSTSSPCATAVRCDTGVLSGGEQAEVTEACKAASEPRRRRDNDGAGNRLDGGDHMPRDRPFPCASGNDYARHIHDGLPATTYERRLSNTTVYDDRSSLAETAAWRTCVFGI
jgi:hypothetical protein